MAMRRSTVRDNRPMESCIQPVSSMKPLAACIRALLLGGFMAAPLAHAELPQVLPGGRWQGTLDPSIANGGLDMVITQTAKAATLDWQKFNISAGSSVRFAQPSSDAVALNRIYDANPSVINGALKANGQIYLINKNGIVFDKNAQVDVNTLVASTLDIKDAVYEQGILSAINTGEAAFVADASMPADATITVLDGAQLGATQGGAGRILIIAPKIVNNGTLNTPGGQAVLAAASDRVYLAQSSDSNLRGLLVEVGTGGDVTNLGSIIAERGNVSVLGMAVNQEGLVRATTSVSLNGSIRLVAGQNPATSPKINGGTAKGVYYSAQGGELTLGAGSITEVVPEGATEATDGQKQSQSYVDMAGRNVTLKSGARVTVTGGDVDILAQAHLVDSKFDGEAGVPEAGVGVRIESGAVVDVSGDKTSVVSVARNAVAVEARGNELADSPLQRDGVIRNRTLYVDVRKGTPLLNSTGAQGLIERGVGERLAAGGTITLQSTGDVVAEKTARFDISGGKVTYTGGDVTTSKLVSEDGRVFNISEADPNRTYVAILGQNMVIDHPKWGWQETFSTAASRFEPGYVEGKDAGDLVIKARAIAFNGELVAGSSAGTLQRYAPDPAQPALDYLRKFDQRPDGGGITLDMSSLDGIPQFRFADDSALLSDPERDQPLAADRATVLSAAMLNSSGVSRVDVKSTGAIAVDAPLALADNGALTLQAGKITIAQDIRSAGGDVVAAAKKSTGLAGSKNAIVIADADVGLSLADGVNIDVSGRWSNETPRFNQGQATAPVVIDGGRIALSTDGDLTLNAGSVLDVSGGAQLTAGGALVAGKGGAIALSATDGKTKTNPSQFSVAAELRGYAFKQGGSLSLTANDFLIADQARLDSLLQERLSDGNARYTLTGSGALRSLLDTSNGTQRELVDPALFTEGGFADIALTATRTGLELAPGTRIEPRQKNRVVDSAALVDFIAANPSISGNGAEQGSANALEIVPTGTALEAFTRISEVPEYLRGPVDLTLTSKNVFDNYANASVLNIGAGAAIVGERGAKVALVSDSSLLVDGRIETPAGSIALTLNSSFLPYYTPQQMIWLGSQAYLSASGSVVRTPNDLGLRQGQVLDAGTVDIKANLGSIVTAAGSHIVVDGVATTLDLPSQNGGIAPTPVAGRAGAIALTAAESILLQGDLSGRAAFADAAGGELSVVLDPTHRRAESDEIDANQLTVPLDRRFPNDPRMITLAGYTGTLPEPGTALPSLLGGQAFLSAAQVTSGGFDSLRLATLPAASATVADVPQSNGIIRFLGATDLALRSRLTLDAPTIMTADADVQLSAAYVAIGSTDNRFRLDGAPVAGGGTVTLDPVGGAGHLRVDAQLIDLVGDTVLQGFGSEVGGVTPAVDLVSSGDIRLQGTRMINATDWLGSFRTAGDLRLQAQQIYPTTLSHFNIGVEAPGSTLGTLAILGQDGQPGLPLSAGGSVTFSADTIRVRDGAIVRAPLGEIVLTGDASNTAGDAVGAQNITLESGSLLSASAAGLSIPFGFTQFQKDLVLPIPGKTLQFVVDPQSAIEKPLPEKSIRLKADTIDVQPGAQFDLAGGGDVRATEFIPGPGGSKDILLADLDTGSGINPNQSFAIIPGLGSEFAPFDPIDSPAAQAIQGIRIGDTLTLAEGIKGLPAGKYAVLPARYALFGGYLVTPVAGSQDILTGQNQTRLDGAAILTGRTSVAGSVIADSRTQGFAIEDATRVRVRAQYAEITLDQLFAGSAANLPRDAGTLTVEAGAALRLAGSLVPTTTGGRGSAVDIVANQLSILSQPGTGAGVELLASDLEGLHADSLLIGATRTLTADGMEIDPGAEQIDVAAGVTLAMRELILVADRLHLGTDSGQATHLSAVGTAQDAPRTLTVNGNAAVAMVSVARGANITRNADASTAELTVAEDTKLTAPGSIVLDANGDVNLAGSVESAGGSLAMGGASVSLGETDNRGLSGLVLSNAVLANLNGSDFSLRSGSGIDIYGVLQNNAGQALHFGHVSLDGQGIVGRDNSGATASLVADALDLRNSTGSALMDASVGDGQLELRADQIVLDAGAFAVHGYSKTTLHGAKSVLASGAGELAVDGALNIDTPVLTAAGGADRSITASGALSVTGGDAAATLPKNMGLGARMTLAGDSIAFAGNAVLPSGAFTLTADGDIGIASGANINAAGQDVLFATQPVGTPGGSILMQTQSGSITLNNSSTLNVSGAAAGGGAGRIEFRAAQGTLAVSPTAVLLSKDSSAQSGELVVDAAQLASTASSSDNALSNLNQLLSDTGFLGRRELRIREGDLQLAQDQVWRAHEVKLSADSGHLVIDGSIDASGEKGGSIVLAAGDALDVNGTLDAHSTSATGDGGRVELAALDADGDDLSTGDSVHDDAVYLNADALLDVSPGVNGAAGSVRVRALAYDANNDGSNDAVALGTMDATVKGAAQADVEAVTVVTYTGDHVITEDARSGWQNTLTQFMNTAAPALPSSWRLVPGLEVSSAGDLALPTQWDLHDWRFGADNNIPGMLTLRAAGDIQFNATLTDGFVADQFYLAGTPVAYERLDAGESWGYRLVAGADRRSADVLATQATTPGNITLAPQTKVRTGTGAIELAASGNVDIRSDAAVYTAGLNSGFGPLADIDVNLAALMNIIFDPDFIFRPASGSEFLLGYLNRGQFPIKGGDIRVSTGGDLLGQSTQTRVTDWQPRLGGDFTKGDVNLQNLPTHWAIAYQNFKNGIGTLGGGDLTARVSGDLKNLAIALPTTGKPESAEVVTNDENHLEFAPSQTAPLVNGGGDLHLDVAGNLQGGALQIDRGNASVRVGGDFGAATSTQQPYFAISDTQLQLEARGSVNLGGVLNATALEQTGNLDTIYQVNSALKDPYDPLFFTYSAASQATITALTGDISLKDPSAIQGHGFVLYAPSLRARSLQGGITIAGNLQTFPAPRAQLELLAEGDIRTANPIGPETIIQSDADAEQLPSSANLVVFLGIGGVSPDMDVITEQYLTPPSTDASSADVTGRKLHATSPVHAGDPVPNRIVSRSGSIIGKAAPLDNWQFLLAKQTEVSAGLDIRDMSFRIQHNQATDLSLVSAGGNIVQTLSRNSGDGSFAASRKIFEIAGPGRLDFSAGGNIDLGGSKGIVSVGDTANPALADSGASVVLMAGVAQQPAYDAFIKIYLEESALYRTDLNAFLAGRGIDAAGDPVGAFGKLSRLEQRELILAIFFKELKESGISATSSVNQDYARGFAAIATLFPDSVKGAGNISTPVSVVKTVDGGSIEMLAPFGGINAGATFPAIAKKSDQLGVITGRGGDINIFLDRDLQVNRERVFALQGDLIVWSSNGSIDAGKGAKTVTSVPDPIVTFDANGNAVVTFPPAVDGSGLSAVNGYLFAPRGAINAGDAGIHTSGNLTVGAVQVIGADNIDVGGVSTGVPVASTGIGAAFVGASSISNSGNSLAEDSTSGLGGSGDQEGGDLGLLSVEVLGFGESPGADDADEDQRRKRTQRM